MCTWRWSILTLIKGTLSVSDRIIRGIYFQRAVDVVCPHTSCGSINCHIFLNYNAFRNYTVTAPVLKLYVAFWTFLKRAFSTRFQNIFTWNFRVKLLIEAQNKPISYFITHNITSSPIKIHKFWSFRVVIFFILHRHFLKTLIFF